MWGLREKFNKAVGGLIPLKKLITLLGADDPKVVKPFLEEHIPKLEPLIYDYVMGEQNKADSKLAVIAQLKKGRVQIDVVMPQRDGSFKPYANFNMDTINNQSIDDLTQKVIDAINEYT